MSNFICPCEGTLTSKYGYRTHPITGKKQSFHHGIDIAKRGTVPIHAAAAGVITRANWSNSYGYVVIIKHTIGGVRYDTTYAHMTKSLKVRVGQSVKQGQQIGFMGSTGNSTGQHLHFEINKGGWKWVTSSDTSKNMPNSVDPLKFITIGKTTVSNSSSTTTSTSSSGGSIVEYLNSIGVDSSFANRKKLATQLGITNYSGTAAQNIKLLELYKAKVNAPKPTTPSTTTVKTEYNTITEYLNVIGVDSSYNNRKRLAVKFGIANYSGTAAQNIKLLKLCKDKLRFYVFTGTVTDKSTILKVQEKIKKVKPNWNMYPVQNSKKLWQIKVDAFSSVHNAEAACKVIEDLGYIARYSEA